MAARLIHELEQLTTHSPLVTLAGEPTGGYRRAGAGSRLMVVLPGLVGPADALAALAAALGPDWRTCFVTYPRVTSIEALIAWLEALRQCEGAGAVTIYGGSFGGLVAQAWLRAHPDAIAGIVLSGTGPPDVARAAKNRRAMTWMATLPMPVWRWFLRLAVYLSTTRAPDRAYWRRYYADSIGELSWEDLESRYRVSIGIDDEGPPPPETLSRWRGRLLVLEGERDRVAGSRIRLALRATYPNATFHVFAGAGHGPALERPDEWLQVVTAFCHGDPGRV
jgi:pimeloyl-ACP methyl ester carboxylesterase